jgi:hypothetical protein
VAPASGEAAQRAEGERSQPVKRYRGTERATRDHGALLLDVLAAPPAAAEDAQADAVLALVQADDRAGRAVAAERERRGHVLVVQPALEGLGRDPGTADERDQDVDRPDRQLEVGLRGGDLHEGRTHVEPAARDLAQPGGRAGCGCERHPGEGQPSRGECE